MSRIIHFELAVENPERAIEFYKQAFGWTVHKWEGPMEYYLVSTGEDDQPGINGAIYRSGDGVARTINTIAVNDVDAAVEKVLAAGGTVQMPKSPIPGVGYFAACTDTEGVMFGVMQNDPEAQ